MITVGFCLIGGGGGGIPIAHADFQGKPDTRPRFIPNLIVVKVPATMTASDVQALADKAQCDVIRAVPFSPGYYVFGLKSRAANIRRVTRDAPVSDAPSAQVLSAISIITQQGAGIVAGPDCHYYTHGMGRQVAPQNTPGPVSVLPSDPVYQPSPVSSSGQRWHMEMIHMPQAWGIQFNKIGRTVNVAVLDTGIDPTHPDLKNKILAASEDVVGADFFNPTPTSVLQDPVGHGTHTSGIVAAETDNNLGVAGVAGWNRNGVDVKLLAVKVFDNQLDPLTGDTNADTTTLISGINYATAHGADVMSMSLGTGFNDPLVHAAITAAYNAGITLVASAGNNGPDPFFATFPLFPANYPEVINVSAVGPERTLAIYSSYGNNVAIAAPGGNDPSFSDPSKLVVSTFPTNHSQSGFVSFLGSYPVSPYPGYAAAQGTSMACPHVAGVCGLLLAAGAARNPATIKNIIQTTAQTLDEVPNLNGGNKYGAGLLDAYAAVLSVDIANNNPIPFDAQFSEVAASPTSFGTSPQNTTVGYSFAADVAFAQRGQTYAHTLAPFTINYLGRGQLANPAAITVEIQTAMTPGSIVRTFVGGVNGSNDFDVTALPAGGTVATVQQTQVPRPGTPLTLPDGNYRAVLKINNVARGVIFFTVASRVQPHGRALFSTPFLNPTGVAPEQTLLGGDANFTLSRYNPLRLPTDLDYAQFTGGPNTSGSPRTDVQASFNAILPNGLPLVFSQLNPTVSIAPIGLGFWLDLDRDVTLNPTPNTINAPVGIRLFAANGGWNMIGDPFTFPVNWPTVTVLAGSQSYSLADAASAGIISSALVGYAQGEYVYSVAPAGILMPFQGYWVRAFQDVTLIVPPNDATANTGTSRASHLPAINGWRARIGATVAGDHDTQNFFGVVNGASAAATKKMDIAKPPSGAGHAYVRFIKPDATGRSDAFAADMRSANAATRLEWTVAVSTDRTGADVSLTWDGIGSVPRRSDLTLTDTTTGHAVSLRSRSSYTFKAGEAGSTRLFKITMDTLPSAGALAITNVALVPGRSQAGGGYTLRLNTTADADIVATVKTLGGKTVAAFGERTRAVAVGTTTLHWNGRSADGAPLPVGPYVVEVNARAGDGQTATVRQTLVNMK